MEWCMQSNIQLKIKANNEVLNTCGCLELKTTLTVCCNNSCRFIVIIPITNYTRCTKKN